MLMQLVPSELSESANYFVEGPLTGLRLFKICRGSLRSMGGLLVFSTLGSRRPSFKDFVAYGYRFQFA